MPEQIHVWEKDPASGSLVSAPKPDMTKLPFGFTFPLPALDPDTDTTTSNFRYWSAVEALRRGVDFWEPAMAPETRWYCGDRISVKLLNSQNVWNASYNREKLVFFRAQVSPGTFIYTAASADMLCHELGHAVLDAVQSDLWNLLNIEVAAFHEAFADLSTILCALQVDTIRTGILASTNGQIFCNSRLSRIAEQFGSALHTLFPNDADPDCLRNAYNAFCYVPPSTLPSKGPSSILTASPHSFSRIFTGAMLEILSGMLTVYSAPTPILLRCATFHLRDIIVEAVRSTPVVPHYYATLATEMVVAAENINPDYRDIFRNVFVSRLILAPESPIEHTQLVAGGAQTDVNALGDEDHSSVQSISISLSNHGIDEPVVIDAPADPSKSNARSGAPEGGSLRPSTSEEAARTFAERLFIEGLVDFRDPEVEDIQHEDGEEGSRPSRTTHRLVRIEGRLHLKRIRIQCCNCMTEYRSN